MHQFLLSFILRRPWLLLIIVTVLFYSCKKEGEEYLPLETVTVTAPNYYFFSDARLFPYDFSTIKSSDDNIVMCAKSNAGCCIMKVSKSGNLIWKKDFYQGSGYYPASITESFQNYFICGNILGNTGQDLFLTKLNQDGDTLWNKSYFVNSFGNEQVCIVKTSDGNLLICGNVLAGTEIYILKVNQNGDVISSNTYPGNSAIFVVHAMETVNSDILLTGYSISGNQHVLYYLRVDSAGNKLWDKYIGAYQKIGKSTIELSNGDFVTCGLAADSVSLPQLLLIKVDHTGTQIWEKKYRDVIGSSVKENTDGSFSIAGNIYNTSLNRYKTVIQKVDSSGNLLWYKNIDNNFQAMTLLKDINDDNIVIGNCITPGVPTVFITKIDNQGNFY
ncbi:MAG: hypothetical protein ABI772_15740 [Bacteroidota bacterium]